VRHAYNKKERSFVFWGFPAAAAGEMALLMHCRIESSGLRLRQFNNSGANQA
jgi:hypothetical protein